MYKKIALGTAQFGSDYGITNEGGMVPIQEAKSIVMEAYARGIDMLDTAIAYGESEAVLGKINVSAWKVITKLPKIPDLSSENVSEWVENQVNESLARLKTNSLYGVLLHSPNQLHSFMGDEIYLSLVRLKKMGKVKKIGVSIYAPDELDKIFDRMHFDIVQAPFNILDRRIVDSGWDKRLKQINVELHARSIYLQGLLLMPEIRQSKQFEAWKGLWAEWHRWLAESNLTPLDACLGYALSFDSIDRIVVGIDSLAQLNLMLLSAKNKKFNLKNLPNWPSDIDIKLLNPANWKPS
jgi:aryl-alcohol dehydrogenase-like predicted oxidoreductase